jgi:FKBP-type peptidyl-prolyl cis-trans isomerase FkpA
MKSFAMALAVLLSAHACSDQKESTSPAGVPSQKEVNRSMEDINRRMSQDEDAVIQGFAERRGWEMTKTGTGLRYMIYEAGPDGPLAQEGQFATVEYEVSLIDGSVVYSSNEKGNRTFLIGQDNVETGIHEAITYLKVGDRAKVILPSHLAHGLSGDQQKIPPRSTVIYDLHLLSLR